MPIISIHNEDDFMNEESCIDIEVSEERYLIIKVYDEFMSDVELNNVQKIKKMLDCGLDPNKISNAHYSRRGYTTPLHISVLNGLYEMTKILLEAGCDPNIRVRSMESPLFYAKDVEIAELLLSKGADINKLNSRHQNAFFYKIETGNIKMLEFLVSKGAKTDIIDYQNKTVFHDAQKLEVFSFLFKIGLYKLAYIKDNTKRNILEIIEGYSQSQFSHILFKKHVYDYLKKIMWSYPFILINNTRLLQKQKIKLPKDLLVKLQTFF
jgi:hypothetical protein